MPHVALVRRGAHGPSGRHASDLSHPRTIGWLGNTALAMGGSNQSLFLIGALVAAQGSAAVPLLALGLLLAWMALPGWTELILIWPDRVGGIAASCSKAFQPYSPVLASLAGTCYWWGWVPTCGLTALLSASALHQWYLPGIPVRVLAAAIVVAFTVANLLGLRRVTRLAVVLAGGSAALAFLSAVLPVVAGHVDWQQASSLHLRVPFGGPFGHFTSAMAGLYLVGFAAPAFEAAACHVGETIDPTRNIPRAMFASAAMATLYFLVLPVIWLGMFGPAPLTRDLTQTLGPTFAPLFGGLAKAAATWFLVLNMFHGTLTPVTGVARTLSQLSEDGLLPRSLGRRTRRDVPWVASVLTAGMAIAFLLGLDPVWVIAAANFAYLIGISMPSVAVWLLRKKQPDLDRPYRAPRGTIGLGLLAATGWGIATLFGFEQFGLPTVLVGLGFAYTGAGAYALRRRLDRHGGAKLVRRSLHLKLTGAMMVVLSLDGIGYLLAVSHLPTAEPSLVAGLKDVFVAVAMLTVTVGLLLPSVITSAATDVAIAADRLAKGTLADLTRAMRALATGDLENARARVATEHVSVVSADEIGAVANSFNVIVDEAARVAESLDEARDALQASRRDLEALVLERTVHAAQQAAVAELSRVALASSDVTVICDRAIAMVAATLQTGCAVLFDFRPGDGTVRLIRARASGGRSDYGRLSSGETARWMAALDATSPSRLDVVGASPLFDPGIGDGPGLLAPIALQQQPFGGLVCRRSGAAAGFTPDDVSFVGVVAGIVGTVVDRIRNEEELNHQALHDPLTGLPNRVLLVDRLTLALARLHRQRGTIAVLFVDIDQFKVINDSLGHDQGDRLLVLMAQRLTGAVRPGDTVARFGGDEFVVLCEDLLDEAEAVAIGERIRQTAATPLLLEGRDYFVTVSTGIALTESADMPAADLLRDADSAMYQAKESGRARSAVFAQSMRTRAVRRLETELALRRAIGEGQLRVHYQPIVSLTTGRVDGVEALVRWEHPTEGMIMPDEFIPIAEEAGLIVPLGEWVLGQACRQVQAWRTDHPQLAHLSVSVNLSGRQIAQSDLSPVVANVLADTGLPPSHLILEITESVLMADAKHAITVLRSLKSHGVRLAIDDFGTGYSSLSYLKKFPVDILKIDRSFVDGLGVEADDSAIVQATITLAHSLGLTTVAEGAETPDQVSALIRLGCDKAQGYHFSRPQPADLLTQSLLRSPSPPVTTSPAHRGQLR